MVRGTVTVLSGSALRSTFTVTLSPSATVYEGCSKLTVTEGTSSSVIETVASFVVPALTPVGRVPKPNFTDSSSSSTSSSVAVKTNVLSVSPALNVTPAGTV